ncbi:TPA: hypothetical protein DIC40_02370 [Patescibacteria group bacterium]|nr:hypothetical protein [Candidatus Gracilibacteria bacterium]
MAVKKTVKKSVSSPKKGAKVKVSENNNKKPAKISKVVSPEKVEKKPNVSSSKVIEKSNLLNKLDIFRDCEIKDGRIFLKKGNTFADFPDILALQKMGYDTFINKYLERLFNTINPVWDIA